MVRMCELMTLACATALVAGSAASAADTSKVAAQPAKADGQVTAPSSARQAVNNIVNNAGLFAAPGDCSCTWDNGAFDGRDGQVSHLGGAVPTGQKAADDFYLCEGFVYELNRIDATLLTTTFAGLVKPIIELYDDCNGCPNHLLYTFDNVTVTETNTTFGLAFDGRPLRIVNISATPANQVNNNIGSGGSNRYVALKGGIYWLSIYGRTDGLCQSMNMCDVTYWGTTGPGIKGLPAKKITGLQTTYGQFSFGSGCDNANGWHSVTEDCCIGCTDLNFAVCTTPCKILVDNGDGRRQTGALEPVGSTSQFAAGLSAFDSRTADDFVVPPCSAWRICYVEGCILTNCPTFDGVFEIYSNNCNKPSYTLHGTPLQGPFTATKIIPLGYTAIMDNRMVSAFKLEFHNLNIVLAGGSQYWISVGVRYTFSLNERAYFCYNADCRRTCLIRWNDGRVLTNTTIDFDSAAHGGNTPGWAKTGNDNSFLIAAEKVTTPGGGNGSPSCPGDFNFDGSVNVQDIFDFLHAWFTGCP